MCLTTTPTLSAPLRESVAAGSFPGNARQRVFQNRYVENDVSVFEQKPKGKPK
jgi:hypothetical protein